MSHIDAYIFLYHMDVFLYQVAVLYHIDVFLYHMDVSIQHGCAISCNITRMLSIRKVATSPAYSSV